ncbi:hypothetical protein QQF64_023551 [Cirrhinus molitorella]|uniref:DDE Tnp4 domain-containing protein n=1 Tax=Cirrhinus molitorella TaxID=172907 RepID=A0ABR3NJM4_9TELE
MRYNEVHARARTVVERANGLLKCRWRALDASGGKLLYHQAKVCKIIRACGVLHNVALRAGIPLPPDLLPPSIMTPSHIPLLDMRDMNKVQESVRMSCSVFIELQKAPTDSDDELLDITFDDRSDLSLLSADDNTSTHSPKRPTEDADKPSLRRSEEAASESDKDAGSLPPFLVAFPQSQSCGPDKSFLDLLVNGTPGWFGLDILSSCNHR